MIPKIPGLMTDEELSLLSAVAGEGVLYVAYGREAAEAAKRSISSLRRHTDLPVAVVSDESLGIEGTSSIYHPGPILGQSDMKTRMYSLSPFRKTLYLDVDTEVRADPVRYAFKSLDYFDLVISVDAVKILNRIKWPGLDVDEFNATIKEVGASGEVQYYASEAIAFTRNERLRNFFRVWHEEWSRWQKHDQLAFVRALFRCPIRIALMREMWNTHRESVAKFVWRRAKEGMPR